MERRSGFPGLLLFLLGHSWVSAVGIALVAVAVPPSTLGVGLLIAALVTQWSARRKSFV